MLLIFKTFNYAKIFMLQRVSQIRSMPFTGDSSDSDSDGGGDGITTNHDVDGVNYGGRRTPLTNRTRGITPKIVNQPPTPLLPRKKNLPGTLAQVTGGSAGTYECSLTASKFGMPTASPKALSNKSNSISNASPNSNNNNPPIENTTASIHSPKAASVSNIKSNGFIPSTPSNSVRTVTPSHCSTAAATPSMILGASFMSPFGMM